MAVTYFDHNASSPLLPEARAAWLEAEDAFPGNPSSPHRIGARADRALDEARQRVAAALGGAPSDVVFTSGATEACNAVLRHAAVTGGPDAMACVSAVEHPAVLESARREFGGRLDFVPVNRRGVIELDWLERHLARVRPALVAVMAANNETGVLQPWREARALCAAREVLCFCDATQWCGREPSAGLGACDFVAGSAHKFGGPRGVGFLKTPARGPFRALLHGGAQQDGRRAGTENVAGAVALAAAFDAGERRIAGGDAAVRRGWRDAFERALPAALPGVQVVGAGAERLWNTASVVMPEADCRRRWVVMLDKAGFAVSTGSACASGSERPSHVLTAMGLDAAAAGRALRFSAGWLTREEDWRALLDALVATHAALPAGGRNP